jgi:hypothetical protein
MSNSSSDDEWVSVDEAAEILGVTPGTVRKRCATGSVVARKVGRNWVVSGHSITRPPPRRRSRQSSAASTLVDLQLSLDQLRMKDLRDDVWVPDVLQFEDLLAKPDRLIREAGDRIDGTSRPESPEIVPVPKSSFFLRNAANLSLVDRLAYHGIVASFAGLIEKQMSDSVYSARLSTRKSVLLRKGLDAFVLWRRDVVTAVCDESLYMIATDITSFFDFVKLEILLPELESIGVDNRLVTSLRTMLKAWSPAPNTGIPQGPDVSRVLGNFYMAAVDHVMDGIEGIQYFRYMDDIRIVGPSRSTVISALQELDSECRRRGLALSTKKTELLHGVHAVRSMQEAELDAFQYWTDAGSGDDLASRKRLATLFRKSVRADGPINARWARFSLWRLFKLRDQSVLSRVLASLEDLSPLGSLIPKYMHPWLRQPSTQRKVNEFLGDAERNTSTYLSTWLLAIMLDVGVGIPSEWIDYSRRVALDPSEPTFHRAMALNVLVLGRKSRDIDAVQELTQHDHDPELVRAALVALRRVDRLTKDVVKHARPSPFLDVTVDRLMKTSDLPSLVFSARRNSLITGSREVPGLSRKRGATARGR